MAKKEMTWMDVIREQLNKMRKEGKHPSIGDVTPIAKKEWEDIKAGKHPLYIQGSSKGKKNKTHKLGKSKGNKLSKGKGKGKGMKTRKLGKSNLRVDTPMPSNKTAIEQMLSSVHLCKKDAAKVMKYVKSVKQSGGGCGCDKQSGGKGKGRGSGKRRGRKMKGGAGAAGAAGAADSADSADSAESDSAADKEAFTDTLDKETGEYASDETEKDVVNEAVESP